MLFVVLVGLTCFFQLLPPGWLLLAVPVIFFLGLHLLVVKGLQFCAISNNLSSCSQGFLLADQHAAVWH